MTHSCPRCGAELAADAAMCSVCKAGLHWSGGKPLVSTKRSGARRTWRLAIGGAALSALVLVAIWLISRPPTSVQAPAAGAAATPAAPAPHSTELTADQAATLASLQRVDDYPLYTMHYVGGMVQGQAPASSARARAAEPAWACALFAALGDPANRLYGRNFDWQYSPALLLFTDAPSAGGYASVSMVDIAYLGFEDGAIDLTTLPLDERRGLLEAPFWPADGLNETGVAVGMAAVPTADERHDPGKPAIDSPVVMREILDRAGNVDEAVEILSSYNIAWDGGPPLHYLVADRTGRAALVEYTGGRIAVLPNDGAWHAATNFTRSAVSGDAAGQCLRYDTLVRRLAAAHGLLDAHDALGLLQTVSQAASRAQSSTQWSVVYGLNTGRADVVLGRNFDRIHSFSLR